jgi:hypothetical protein
VLEAGIALFDEVCVLHRAEYPPQKASLDLIPDDDEDFFERPE